MSVKLLIVDDHEVVRTGLVSLFNGSDVKVVAEATTGTEAVKMTAKHNPDVVLLDIRLPGLDGFEALEKIRAANSKAKVVMLSTWDNPTYVARAVALGASDFMLKGASRQDLITAITSAAAGKGPSRVGELHKVAGAMSKNGQAPEGDVPLTNRETQVLRHVALGLSNKEIGRALTISIETVKEHVQNILRKISVTDRTQAAVWAVRRKLV